LSKTIFKFSTLLLCLSTLTTLSDFVCNYLHDISYTLKQLIQFNRYSSLNFKVHISGEYAVVHWIYSGITNHTVHSFFQQLKRFNDEVISAAHAVFKQDVQNVHQLQQHTIKVCCEMIRLPYQWTCGKLSHIGNETVFSSAIVDLLWHVSLQCSSIEPHTW